MSATLLLFTCATPPDLMEIPNARLPANWIAVSATCAWDPAPSTERPKPRTPVVVIVLPAPLITILPPLTARTPAFGVLSMLAAPELVNELLVRTRVAPVSASAADALVPEVLAAMPVALIWLPAPVAYRAWLPASVVVFCAPAAVICAPLDKLTTPPLSANTPKAPRELVLTEPPEKLSWLPVPLATRP
ncbi:hypothetical protein D3C72_1790030 [compost metagenome]